MAMKEETEWNQRTKNGNLNLKIEIERKDRERYNTGERSLSRRSKLTSSVSDSLSLSLSLCLSLSVSLSLSLSLYFALSLCLSLSLSLSFSLCVSLYLSLYLTLTHIHTVSTSSKFVFFFRSDVLDTHHRTSRSIDSHTCLKYIIRDTRTKRNSRRLSPVQSSQ